MDQVVEALIPHVAVPVPIPAPADRDAQLAGRGHNLAREIRALPRVPADPLAGDVGSDVDGQGWRVVVLALGPGQAALAAQKGRFLFRLAALPAQDRAVRVPDDREEQALQVGMALAQARMGSGGKGWHIALLESAFAASPRPAPTAGRERNG